MCAHIGYTGPGEPLEDGEMNEMTLPPDTGFEGLRPSTLPLGHGASLQYQIFTSEREETFFFFESQTGA